MSIFYEAFSSVLNADYDSRTEDDRIRICGQSKTTNVIMYTSIYASYKITSASKDMFCVSV